MRLSKKMFWLFSWYFGGVFWGSATSGRWYFIWEEPSMDQYQCRGKL